MTNKHDITFDENATKILAGIEPIKSNLYFNDPEGKEILRIEADGATFFKGERLTNNRQLEYGLIALLESHGLYYHSPIDKLDALLLSLSNAERELLREKLNGGKTS